MGHARALLGTPDRAFQEQLAKRAVAEDLSVREVEEAIRLREESNPTTRREPEVREAPRLRVCSSWRSCWATTSRRESGSR